MIEQLLLHFVGDYWLQTEHQQLNKRKSSWVCLRHVITYSLPFLLIGSWMAVLAIAVSHFIIDRTPLVNVAIYMKNQLVHLIKYTFTGGDVDTTPYNYNAEGVLFGQSPERPDYIRFLIYVVCDNTLHLLCNYFALKYLIL